jgi:hypothetical protein
MKNRVSETYSMLGIKHDFSFLNLEAEVKQTWSIGIHVGGVLRCEVTEEVDDATMADALDGVEYITFDVVVVCEVTEGGTTEQREYPFRTLFSMQHDNLSLLHLFGLLSGEQAEVKRGHLNENEKKYHTLTALFDVSRANIVTTKDYLIACINQKKPILECILKRVCKLNELVRFLHSMFVLPRVYSAPKRVSIHAHRITYFPNIHKRCIYEGSDEIISLAQMEETVHKTKKYGYYELLVNVEEEGPPTIMDLQGLLTMIRSLILHEYLTDGGMFEMMMCAYGQIECSTIAVHEEGKRIVNAIHSHGTTNSIRMSEALSREIAQLFHDIYLLIHLAFYGK